MAINSHVPFKNPQFMETEIEGIKVYPDWIEIFNPTEIQINLGGWYLTDNDNKLTKWEFPSGTTLGPYEYLIVFASNKNKSDYQNNFPFRDDLGYLHTNFGLSSKGEYLALVKPDGVTITQEYDFPEQRGLISYGMDNNADIGYLLKPSPGSNNSDLYEEFVSDTKFSIDRGYFDTPIEVTISTQTKDASIYYTLDSSTPTDFNGHMYTGPISIQNTTVLKAAAYKNGMLPTDVDTQTYIFIDNVLEQERNHYPKNWERNIPGDYELNELVISSCSKQEINNAFMSLPAVSISTDDFNLFGYDDGIYIHSNQDEYSGLMWERECSFEYFEPDKDSVQINCGIRISGDSSSFLSNNKKLSFRLLFKGGYGPSRLNFNLFENKESSDIFDHLMLKTFFNDSWLSNSLTSKAVFIKNSFLNETFIDMGQINPNSKFVHLYLNGMYWGIYELQERPNSDFQSEYFGSEPDAYDILNNGKEPAMDGNYSVWNTIIEISENPDGYSTLQGLNPDYTENPDQEVLLNIENLIDYIILNYYSADKNWQWFAGRLRGEESSGFRFFVWDAEEGLNNVFDREINETVPLDIFKNLFSNNEDFRILTADRIYKHLYNDGALSNNSALNRFNAISEEIEKAVLLESARWGYSTGNHLFIPADWETEKNRLINDYFSSDQEKNRTYYVKNLFTELGYYPDIPAPEYYINNEHIHGGHLTSQNNTLTIKNNGSGEIYYTTDGTDPRLPGGEINKANIYTEPIILNKSMQIKSRTYQNGKWSALNEAVFTVGLITESLRITEIMYHPAENKNGDYSRNDFEYIELKNVNKNYSINLSMIHFSDGIDYTFPSYELLPGEYIVLVKNIEAFMSRYPDADRSKIFGPFSGNLNNSGETLTLNDGNDKLIFEFSFNDKWFDVTDGIGFSLNVSDSEFADTDKMSDKEYWQTSSVIGGTPLKEDTGWPFNPDSVIINEVLAHSHDNAPDWIELYNRSDFPADISGWYLSDEKEPEFKKYRFNEGTVIPSKGYIVFTEDDDFRNEDDPGCLIPFSLNDDGEMICITPVVNNQIIDDYITEEIGASETGISWGIHIKSTGKTDFIPLKLNTPGSINSEPKTGPLVINEIMYNPSGNGDAEYVELLNIGREPLILYDEETGLFWNFNDNGGVNFDISESGSIITINPFECIVLVKNRYAFNLEYNADRNIRIYEWGTDGKLSNGGEKLQILKPGEFENNVQYYIFIDIVNFNDRDPWPESADGTGYSLHRIDPDKYGNDPANWQALEPSPGIR